MKHSGPYRLPFAMGASLLAVGIPYWMIPYNELGLPSSLLGPGLIVVAVSALLLCMFNVASFGRGTFMIGAAVGAAVMIRVIVDGANDPTSHNLWPLEMAIALTIGFACVAAGAILGRLMARLLPRIRGE